MTEISKINVSIVNSVSFECNESFVCTGSSYGFNTAHSSQKGSS